MRILIKNNGNIRIESKDDLNRFIPKNLSGQVLNYGQGEGQILLDGKVWGIYTHPEIGNYCLQFEEGIFNWGNHKSQIDILLNHISNEFGQGLSFVIEGCHQHREPDEKFT